ASLCRDLAALARDPVPFLPLAAGFLAGAAISSSRIACLRASLRRRRTASVLSRSPVRGLLTEAPAAHLPEHTFALHLPPRDAKRLLDVIVSNEYLHACCSKDRRCKLSKLPALGASRYQARKFIQGTSPVEMKRIPDEILSRLVSRRAKDISKAMTTRPIWS